MKVEISFSMEEPLQRVAPILKLLRQHLQHDSLEELIIPKNGDRTILAAQWKERISPWKSIQQGDQKLRELMDQREERILSSAKYTNIVQQLLSLQKVQFIIL
jgi:hypothetical protein